MSEFLHHPRGISRMTPIFVMATLLLALFTWIMWDLYRKRDDYDRAAQEKLILEQRRSVAPVNGMGTLQPPAAQRPIPAFVCRWAQAPLTITGEGSDPVWQGAQMIDSFYLPWLGERQARTRTQARLLWNEQYLYFLAVMDDFDLYAETPEQHGKLEDGDVFEMFLKPSLANKGYYEFGINPRNTSQQLFLPSRGSGGFSRWKDKYTFHLESKVALRGTLNNAQDRDQGWTVEGRIPWGDFSPTSGRPLPGSEWKMALCRTDYSIELDQPEFSTCAPLRTPNGDQYEDYCTLKFEGALK